VKRVLTSFLLFLTFLAIVGITSCGRKAVLNIYSWAEYVPEEVIEQFEEEFNCRIVYDTYDSNETMYAKLRAGGAGYDIVFPSGDYTSIMIREGMLKSIDRAKIPNLANLDPRVTAKINYDPEHEYSVPYMIGTTGIAVNKKYFSEYPRSWRILEMEEIRGKATLLDDMREVMGAALKTLGYSVNSLERDQLNEAKELVLLWKDSVAKFDNELFAKGVVSGEFWVVHGYGENIFYEATEEEIEDIDFFIPEEGSTLWIDNMVILKDSKHSDLAHEFINFILRPDVSAEISDYLLLPSPNSKAAELLTEEPIYELADLEDCEMIEDIGEDLVLFNEIWNEIRFGL